MAGVTVRGTARREVQPDRVRLALSLTAEAERSDQALAELTRRSEMLDRVLDGAGDAVLGRRPSGVHVGPSHDRRGQERGQRAVRSVEVEVRASAAPGELLAAAVAGPQAAVSGARWTVDDDNPAHAELRAAAVIDARARAEVYAKAAGMRLGGLDWLAEPGLGAAARDRDAVEPERGARMMAAAESADDGQAVLDLRPEPVPVTASVEARYLLLPGPVDDEGGNYL